MGGMIPLGDASRRPTRIPVVTVLPYQQSVAEADRAGAAHPGTFDAAVAEHADELLAVIDSLAASSAQPPAVTQSAS